MLIIHTFESVVHTCQYTTLNMALHE